MGPTRNATIVLATDSHAPSGVGEHMLTLAATLRQHHRMVLAFPETQDGEGFPERARRRGFETLALADDGMSFDSPLRKLGPALLHVHAGVGWEGHGLVGAGRIAEVPIIRTEHLPYVLTDEDQKREHLRTVDTVDRVVFVSESAHETFRQAGANGKRSVTIRNGILRPIASNGRAVTRAGLGIPDGDTLILTVARFTQQKGYAFLLHAAGEIVRRIPTARFLLVGDGPERGEMQALADALGLAHCVRFLGERNDVADLLAAADVFVLPSLFEGLPLVVLEAMALGLAVVATNIGGTAEALGADYPWLVEPASAPALATEITEAIGDDAKRRDVGARNMRRYGAEFTAERMGRETAAVYRAVATEGACRA